MSVQKDEADYTPQWLREIEIEISRQDESWGEQRWVPDDRWVEICEDEFRDLKWSVRVPLIVKENHDTRHELVQTIATLCRWLRARS